MGYGEYGEYRGYGSIGVMGYMGYGGTTHEPKFNHLLLQSDTNLTEL